MLFTENINIVFEYYLYNSNYSFDNFVEIEKNSHKF